MASLRADCTYVKCNLEVPLGGSQPSRQSDGRRVVAVSHCTRGRPNRDRVHGNLVSRSGTPGLEEGIQGAGNIDTRGAIPVVGIVRVTTRSAIAERPGSRQGTPRPDPNDWVKVAVRRGSLRGRFETDPECPSYEETLLSHPGSQFAECQGSRQGTPRLDPNNGVKVGIEKGKPKIPSSIRIRSVSFMRRHFCLDPAHSSRRQGSRQSTQRLDTSGCVKVAEKRRK